MKTRCKEVRNDLLANNYYFTLFYHQSIALNVYIILTIQYKQQMQSVTEHFRRGQQKEAAVSQCILETILKIPLEMENELHDPVHCELQIYLI